MRLKVGGTYKTRYGSIVDIIKDDGHDTWPFIGKERTTGTLYSYREGGRWSTGPHSNDLIEEVTPTPTNPS